MTLRVVHCRLLYQRRTSVADGCWNPPIGVSLPPFEGH
jgi:hypothetical protein